MVRIKNIEKALQKVLGFGPKEFIKKAIEGGWKDNLPNKYYEYSYEAVLTRNHGLFHLTNIILLEPSAWQAVGKVEGWKPVCMNHWEVDGCLAGAQTGWLYNMHETIDALAEQVEKP